MIESGGMPDGCVVGHEVSGVIEEMGAEVTGHSR
jgi:D-arabinose 1-dehydrogenase-like Zn-dependent alcohol dehydrogenase